MKKNLIFGGYGFIGTNLFRSLKNPIRFTSKNKINKNYSLSFFKWVIKKFNPKNIFFLSGNSYPLFSRKKHLLDIKENNIKLQNLLNAALETKFKGKIIYTSSIAVYGSNKKRSVNENEKLNPESFYALSKIMAEKQCEYFSKKGKINIIILRLCSIFGPGLKRQIIYELIKKILLNKQLNITVNGNQDDKREFLYVDDLIRILKKISNTKITSGIYNVGSGKQIFISKIFEILKNNLNLRKNIIFRDKIKNPVFSILNNNKLNRKIKFKKKNNFQKNLIVTLNYWKKRGILN